MKNHTISADDVYETLYNTDLHIASQSNANGVKKLVKRGELYVISLNGDVIGEFFTVDNAVKLYNETTIVSECMKLITDPKTLG